MYRSLRRREVLQLAAMLLGSSVSASCTRAVLSGTPPPGTARGAPLGDADLQKAARVADLIIPRTDTPGALDAGVAEFIHHVVADWYTPEERDIFVRGLGELDDLSRSRFGRGFLEAMDAEQLAVLVALEERLPSNPPADAGAPGTSPFFAKIKELTVLGFYTSEVGARDELLYRPVPGAYRGDALFNGDARQWSL